MKDSEIRIRTDKEFLDKVDFLLFINGYKNKSDAIRRTIEKEYRKEVSVCEICHWYMQTSNGFACNNEHGCQFEHAEP